MKLLVIGGGPGGYVAAIRAAQLGAEVTLVEKDKLGGTCLNVGCIPTKALLQTAKIYEQAKSGERYGVIARPKLDFAEAQAQKNRVVQQLVSGVHGLMKANRIQVLSGHATLIDSKSASISTGQTISFDKAIVAVGSVPAQPPIPGADSPPCIDSTGALALTTVPSSMVIIGGGVIGVEMATIYAALGCKVTIVEMMDEILPMMDQELTKVLRGKLEQGGIQIITGCRVERILQHNNAAVVEAKSGGKAHRLTGEKVLVAVGRKINTQALGLEQAGIQHDGGRILVNQRQETNVPGIYAIGDCTGGSMLAHVASMQGEIAAENAMGHSSVYRGDTSPSCVYTSPEFAGAGLTEEACKRQGIEYVVGRFPLAANGKSLLVGEDGMVKVIAGKEHREILGIHMVGPRATDLMVEGALAIGTESTLDEIIATIHPHPTVGEAIREAALAADKRAIHIPNR